MFEPISFIIGVIIGASCISFIGYLLIKKEEQKNVSKKS